jgi:negative regulator of the PHO system
LRIYQTLGTPTEERWPNISEIPDYKPIFPVYPAIDLSLTLPKLKGLGIELLLQMLEYAPELRISAEVALTHAFFADLPNQ